VRRTPCTAAAPGAALVAAVTVLALVVQSSELLIPLLIVGPLFAAVRAMPQCTAGVAALAVACALPLGLVDDFMSAEHAAETAAVVAGGALAFLVAAGRQRFEEALVNERAARRRSEIIAGAGRLLEAPPEPEAMLEQIVRLPVPDIADICIVDLVRDGELGATWVHAVDERSAELLRESRARYPLDAGGPHPVAIVARTGQPHIQAEIGPERLRAFAADEEHLQRMLVPGYGSSLAVPLVARGRTVGVLSFMRFGRSSAYTDSDAELAGEVAGRAALALDNAQLFAELRRAERQLEAVLGNLAAAVTVQAPDGSLIYVNQVAAEMLECASPDEVLATPMHRILERFVILDERGAPFDFAQLPGRHALAGLEAAPVLVHSVVKATGAERWALTKATPVRDENGDVVLAVNIIEDVTDARRAERQQRFLSAASKLVSSSLDIDVTLDKVAWAAVPEIGDWCCVDMPDERGVLRRVAVAAGEGEQDSVERVLNAVRLDVDEAAHPLRSGRSLLAADFDEEILRAWAGGDPERAATLVASGTRSAMVVPMTAGDRVIGLITLGTSRSARRLGDEEVVLAEELGRRAGIAVENARLHEARSHIATTLQRSLLPPRLPTVPGLTVAARFRAAGETSDVGGDFYDLFPSGDAWMVVVGDVTGKGPAAAAITSLARFTMRTAAMYEHSPAAVLGRLNEALAVDPDRRQLCTAVCARIEPGDDGTLVATVARGGHPPPFLVSAGGAEAVGTPGPLLGAFEESSWEERVVVAAAGDALVFYTDGVTDTRGEDGELFGQDRLAELLDTATVLDADELASRIDGALQSFERGQQRDDVAMLVVRSGDLESDALLDTASVVVGHVT
jgi:serine phosphatase RsbU (regulator of sigma subunit)/PAS domain-containing protein